MPLIWNPEFLKVPLDGVCNPSYSGSLHDDQTKFVIENDHEEDLDQVGY